MDPHDVDSIYWNYNDCVLKLTHLLKGRATKKITKNKELCDLAKRNNYLKIEVCGKDVCEKPIKIIKEKVVKIVKVIKEKPQKIIKEKPKPTWTLEHVNICPKCKFRKMTKIDMFNDYCVPEKTKQFTWNLCEECK